MKRSNNFSELLKKFENGNKEEKSNNDCHIPTSRNFNSIAAKFEHEALSSKKKEKINREHYDSHKIGDSGNYSSDRKLAKELDRQFKQEAREILNFKKMRDELESLKFIATLVEGEELEGTEKRITELNTLLNK